MYARNILRCSSLSLNGMMIATLSRATQLWGCHRPPFSSSGWSILNSSNVGMSYITAMGPTEIINNAKYYQQD